MIRYLGQEEYGKCLPLWQEAFPEDSQAFLGYYFNKKLPGSRVLVKEDGSGSILTMAHLNPYTVMVRGRRYRLSYIVGVATAASSRHQGHMRDVLVKMLQDMHDSREPFCYLMPASPDIYRPFGFTYVFDQPLWELGDDGPAGEKVELRLDGPEAEWLSQWMNRWLDARFQVYGLRDKAYLDMLQAELDSEDGHVWGWLDSQGELAALQAFWGIRKQEQRFLYSDREEWLRPAESGRKKDPGIMARITDVTAMAEPISLNEECPCPRMEVLVRIRDRLIKENDGLWRWKLDMDSSSLDRTSPVHEQESGRPGGSGNCLMSTEVLDITVDQLASWLFGYMPLDGILEEDGTEPPFWCRYIRPLEGIFLDEIV